MQGYGTIPKRPWNMEHGPWNVEHGTWNVDHGTWNMEREEGHAKKMIKISVENHQEKIKFWKWHKTVVESIWHNWLNLERTGLNESGEKKHFVRGTFVNWFLLVQSINWKLFHKKGCDLFTFFPLLTVCCTCTLTFAFFLRSPVKVVWANEGGDVMSKLYPFFGVALVHFGLQLNSIKKIMHSSPAMSIKVDRDSSKMLIVIKYST